MKERNKKSEKKLHDIEAKYKKELDSMIEKENMMTKKMKEYELHVYKLEFEIQGYKENIRSHKYIIY